MIYFILAIMALPMTYAVVITFLSWGKVEKINLFGILYFYLAVYSLILLPLVYRM